MPLVGGPTRRDATDDTMFSFAGKPGISYLLLSSLNPLRLQPRVGHREETWGFI